MTEGSKRIAFVTGANKGIGFEVARSLGKAGLTILVGGRNRELGEAATATLRAEGTDARYVEVDARYVEVDVVRRATIEAAAAMITAEFQRLDVLINNAGINDPGDGPPSAADLGAVRRVIETNFLGAVAVTQAMLPLLRKSAAGRIVNVSSGLGSLNWNADPNWEFARSN
jgi:NAD(P)-dependent dehydrogenase (short-subunit alcohol dehydrogenase family)